MTEDKRSQEPSATERNTKCAASRGEVNAQHQPNPLRDRPRWPAPVSQGEYPATARGLRWGASIDRAGPTPSSNPSIGRLPAELTSRRRSRGTAARPPHRPSCRNQGRASAP